MSFDNLDMSLDELAKATGIVLLSEELPPHRRYFYLSNSAAETIQLVVEPQEGSKIRIDLHPIEEINDEFHVIVEDSVDNINSALLYAYEIARVKLRIS